MGGPWCCAALRDSFASNLLLRGVKEGVSCHFWREGGRGRALVCGTRQLHCHAAHAILDPSLRPESVSLPSTAGLVVSSRGSRLFNSALSNAVMKTPRIPRSSLALRYTHHNCVTLDQGITVGFGNARRPSSNGCLVVHSRTLLRDLAVRTDHPLPERCAALPWWAKEIGENHLERMAAIHGDSARQPEWELLAIVVSIFGDHGSRRVLLHSSKQTLPQPLELLVGCGTQSCCEQSGSRTWYGIDTSSAAEPRWSSNAVPLTSRMRPQHRAMQRAQAKTAAVPPTDTAVWIDKCCVVT